MQHWKLTFLCMSFQRSPVNISYYNWFIPFFPLYIYLSFISINIFYICLILIRICTMPIYALSSLIIFLSHCILNCRKHDISAKADTLYLLSLIHWYKNLIRVYQNTTDMYNCNCCWMYTECSNIYIRFENG